jgi:hypothetical protein
MIVDITVRVRDDLGPHLRASGDDLTRGTAGANY